MKTLIAALFRRNTRTTDSPRRSGTVYSSIVWRRAFAACALLSGTLMFASGADTAKVSRTKIINVEKLINTQMASMVPDEPYFLIGLARGTYLEGLGVVFSVDINLATGPTVSPFRPPITKEEIARVREKKDARLPLLRTKMFAVIGSMASLLDTLPPNEELILIVTLLRYPYEDGGATLPSQIVMRVPRGKLIEFQRNSTKIDTVIRAQEF